MKHHTSRLGAKWSQSFQWITASPFEIEDSKVLDNRIACGTLSLTVLRKNRNNEFRFCERCMRFPTQRQFEEFKLGLFRLVDTLLWIGLLVWLAVNGLRHIW